MMKEFENKAALQEIDKISKLYQECMAVSKEQNESGSNAVMFSYGDACKRFVKELKKKFPKWHAKAVEIADTAEYTRSTRGYGPYRTTFYYLSFGNFERHTGDPFPGKPKRAEVIQEALISMMRYVKNNQTENVAI